MKPILALAALAATLAAADAAAQTLYKLIDKNGKVTYAEKPPRDFDGKVIRIDIDPERNTATLPKPPVKEEPPPKARPGEEGYVPERPKAEDPVAAARARLEAARKALAKARDNPRDEDYRFIGVVGGGTRRVPTEEYAQRLEGLEREVKSAEEALERAERGR